MTATTPMPSCRSPCADRLLATMFPTEDVCQRSQEAIAAEGFSRGQTPPRRCGRLVEGAGLLSRHRGGPASDQGSAAPATDRTVMRGRREKVFGPGGRAVPLDRNAKARIAAYARAWDRRHRQPGREAEPLGVPPWTSWAPYCGCFTMLAPAAASPSYETIAAKSGCACSTVAEAIKALEFAVVR